MLEDKDSESDIIWNGEHLLERLHEEMKSLTPEAHNSIKFLT